MTYGTLEYWQNQADQLGRQVAGLDKANTELWTRLTTVEQMAARGGVDVQDPALVAHSIELEAHGVAAVLQLEDMEGMRTGILVDAFSAQDGIKKGADKAAAFDWLVKRIHARNEAAIRKRNHIAEARERVIAGRADSVLTLFDGAA